MKSLHKARSIAPCNIRSSFCLGGCWASRKMSLLALVRSRSVSERESRRVDEIPKPLVSGRAAVRPDKGLGIIGNSIPPQFQQTTKDSG
ncbi:MAG: hypothetical protein J7641_20895 [Cyanobacteria bacterium SID2]|nr:hypothetical protein [Cyanobacteria bacterium SID2]MBP0006438.1 hypothetical protein [Cyanobacteria bacterium SBC]